MRFGMLHLFENPLEKTEHGSMELMQDKVIPRLRDSDPPPIQKISAAGTIS